MSSREWSAAARFGGPGIILGLALAWSIGGQRGAHADGPVPALPERGRIGAPAPTGESGGTLAMISQLPPGPNGAAGQLLYVIDTKSRAFAVYRIDPNHAKGTIKLEGVRQYNWDMKLDEYRNQEPDVLTIESAVKAAGSRSR